MEKEIDFNVPIRIDKEGNWYYGSLPIIHPKIFRFLNEHLEPDSKGGYQIRLEKETYPVIVEDTPFVVRVIEKIEAPREYIKIKLNDDTEEILDIDTLWIGKNNIPYCWVKNKRFPARFTRKAYYELAKYINERQGRYFVFLGNKRYYLKDKDPFLLTKNK